jgi:hypothetical protein
MLFFQQYEEKAKEILSIGHLFRIETWAGNGTHVHKDGAGTNSGLYWPYEIKFDSSGNGYFTTFGCASVGKINPEGVITTITNRTTNHEYFSSIRGLALDRHGNIFVADTGNNRIRKISPNGFCETLFTDKVLPTPYAILVAEDGTLYVTSGNCVYSIYNGIVEVFAGASGGNLTGGYIDAVGTDARFLLPQGMEFDKEGNIIVADCKNNVIRKIDKQRRVTTLAKGFKYPYGVVLDKRGNIFVSDYGNNDIKRINPNGQVYSMALKADYIQKPENLSFPTGLGIDLSGNLVICDCYHHIIRKIKFTLEYQASQWPYCESLPQELQRAIKEFHYILCCYPPQFIPKDLVMKLTRTVILSWPV